MNASSPLCAEWRQHVKEFFSLLHGHQSTNLALFVYGAIVANSIVVQRVAEGLLNESQAKLPSIERRLQRFLANERIKVEEVWKHFLRTVLPYWKGKRLTLIIDETRMNNDKRLIYIGLQQPYRTLPLVWSVLPLPLEEEDQRMRMVVTGLIVRLAGYLQGLDCTLTVIGDRGYESLWMVQACQQVGWQYLIRVRGDHLCQRWKHGRLQATCKLSETIQREGQQWYGKVRLWEEGFETQLSAIWKKGCKEPWFLMSDEPACYTRVKEYAWRMRVEATFQDMKSRGWDWEDSHVREEAHLDRLLMVLFLAFWWLTHLAASCIHNGRRDRYDRHDRRDKGVLRLGRLYLLDMEKNTPPDHLRWCLPFSRINGHWAFSLRF